MAGRGGIGVRLFYYSEEGRFCLQLIESYSHKPALIGIKLVPKLDELKNPMF
jgi:hypothetical protein